QLQLAQHEHVEPGHVRGVQHRVRRKPADAGGRAGGVLMRAVVALFLLGAGVCAAENVVVYKETGRFGGWPANNGIWSWGDEIVVGFSLGYFKVNPSGHAIDGQKPQAPRFARSLDGGRTW